MDQQLLSAVAQMREGKEEGFNAVYAATYNHVYFRAKQTMRHEQDAEDLVQIVYAEAYRNIASLQTPDALFGWLDRITYNQGMKMFRKKKDVLLSEEGEGVFDTLETNDIASMPEPTIDDKETGNIIKGLIEELPETQRASLTAYYFDGFSVGKIAEMMECTEGTVKSRLNYARKYLKERILQKEKKEGYALHSFGLPVLWYALWRLSKETKMSTRAAEAVYRKGCAEVGLKAAPLTMTPAFAEAGAGMAQVMPSWASAITEAVTAAGGAAAASGASGSAAGMAGSAAAGVAAKAAGAISVKAVVAAVAAAAVVIAGAAVVIPRVTGNREETARVADADEALDADVLSANEEDAINAAADETDAETLAQADLTAAEEAALAEEEGDASDEIIPEEAYASILNRYRDAIAMGVNYADNPDRELTDLLQSEASYMAEDWYTRREFYYLFYDVNHDDIDELLIALLHDPDDWVDEYTGFDYGRVYGEVTLLDVYATDGENTYKLFPSYWEQIESETLSRAFGTAVFGERSTLCIDDDGNLIDYGSYGITYYGISVYRMDDSGTRVEKVYSEENDDQAGSTNVTLDKGALDAAAIQRIHNGYAAFGAVNAKALMPSDGAAWTLLR